MKKYIYFAAIAALVSGLFFACDDKAVELDSPLELDRESITATAVAASFEVAVTAKGAWTAESDATWATVTPASGSGGGTVTVNVAAASADEERTATITVSSGYVHKEVVVTQAPQTNTALSIDKTTVSIDYAAISYPIVVTSDGAWSVDVYHHT
ncbi:hypothetical protein AGMMS49982_17200 [Bacteroidia bacterium]|nr:hypothetical protein AGMMS49982_17200 [Bacteroidia bacterium]